jgi:TatD DNase family protein
MIDAHIHLNQYNLHTIEKSIEDWKHAGIKQVIAVSNDLRSSYQTLELQMNYPDFVTACIGFHPELPIPNQNDFLEWKTLLKLERKRISAIGEIGLPHYNFNQLDGPLELYIEVLKQYLYEAHRNQLPVALHAVHDKVETIVSLLQQYCGIPNAHFHWLKAPEHVVNQIVNAGYYISVTPEVCYRTRDQQLARRIPIRQLLIETDGPWQFEGEFQNQLTSPLMLEAVIYKLAELNLLSHSDIERHTDMNTKNCYHLAELK